MGLPTLTRGTASGALKPILVLPPEPTTFALMGLGLVGIAASRRRRLS